MLYYNNSKEPPNLIGIGNYSGSCISALGFWKWFRCLECSSIGGGGANYGLDSKVSYYRGIRCLDPKEPTFSEFLIMNSLFKSLNW